MTPLPGWSVIPAGFEAHHRPVVKQTFTALCHIQRPNPEPAPFPEPDDWPAMVTVWSGMCRLQQLQREGSPSPLGQPSQTRDYLLALPFENGQGVALPPVRTGERGDIALVAGRTFNFLQPMTGSILWENDFKVVENQTQQPT